MDYKVIFVIIEIDGGTIKPIIAKTSSRDAATVLKRLRRRFANHTFDVLKTNLTLQELTNA